MKYNKDVSLILKKKINKDEFQMGKIMQKREGKKKGPEENLKESFHNLKVGRAF